MWEKIKQLLAKYGDISFPIKFAIVALMGSLGGSTYIAFLSEYATYYYAWHEGFRIPAEGSQYLNVAINAIGFFGILVSLLLFLAVVLVVPILILYITIFVSWLAGGSNARLALTEIKKANWKQAVCLSFFVSVFPAIMVGKAYLSEATHPVLSAIAVGSLSFIAFLSMWNTRVLIPLSAIVAMVCSILCPAILFNMDIYSMLLRELGYGGRLPVKVVLPESSEKIQTFLYLRTNSSLFLGNDGEPVIEYPVNNITYIEYEKPSKK